MRLFLSLSIAALVLMISEKFTGKDSKALQDEATVLADYEVGQRLGEGAFGTVYEGKYVPSGERFAIKVLQKADLMKSYTSPEDVSIPVFEQLEALEKHIIKEATTMQALEHPHVVKFYKFLNSTVGYYFIMDLADGGELFDLIISAKYFTEVEARTYFQQLMSAINFCHSKGVAHKDLKAENLLLSADGRLLVCDFGFSSRYVENMESSDLHLTGTDPDSLGAGTLHYMSPEAVRASHSSWTGMEWDDEASPPESPTIGEERESWVSGNAITVTKKKEKANFFLKLIAKGTKKSSSERTRKGSDKSVSLHQDPLVTVLSTAAPAVLLVDDFLQDLWSAAVILFFMVTGRLPFYGRDDEETLHLIETGSYAFTEEEASRLSPDLKDLLNQMLQRDPAKRPTCEEVIKDKWFVESLNLPKVFPHLCAAGAAEAQASNFLKFPKTRTEPVSLEEEKYLKKAFDILNMEGTAALTKEQLRDALISLSGGPVKKEEVTKLLVLLLTEEGAAKKSSVAFDEFRLAWVEREIAKSSFAQQYRFQLEAILKLPARRIDPSTVSQLRSAFNTVNSDASGIITQEQLTSFLVKVNIDADESDVLSLIQLFRAGEPLRPDGKRTENVSFDAFITGMQEVLLRHPLGKKIANATNLISLFESSSMRDCLHHGFIAVGPSTQLLTKLLTHRRLTLLENVKRSDGRRNLTFRYHSSEESEDSNNMCGSEPPVSTDFFANRTSMRAHVAADRSIRNRAFHNTLHRRSSRGVLRQPNSAAGVASEAAGSEKGLPPIPSATQPLHDIVVSPSPEPPTTYPTCEVDVELCAVGSEHILVRFRRIYGHTNCFHEAVVYISDALADEHQQAMEDTLPRGESELM